ncbi:MAG TPA: fused MFS/spermidine synthase [Ideonella sp.]|uniref:fused MFS/spermidine synthase n=1 Tax=Ideonella sp. TaxID=1929293 RepID=UPI002E322202|nr:fused MFS/spermidine synthase [Ideonella sp.]HEX5684659.1 fused MFS/spermidine synthase [Ideonella sp.]
MSQTSLPVGVASGGAPVVVRVASATRYLFVACIFLSAFLLFLVQPIIAKQIMPWFGGTSAVWTTCLTFFQLMLLAGYAYSDLATRWLKPRSHALLHVVLLGAAVAFLPILPGEWLKPDPQNAPISQVLLLLLMTVGLPYFCLATTGPLLQAWYTRLYPGSQVYRLFALSNLASLAALLAYPFSIEPYAGSVQQSTYWSLAFGAFAVLCAGCAWASRNAPRPEAAATVPAAHQASSLTPTRKDYALWLTLSAMGSMMLISVTSHITQNIAAVPMLWLLPLSLYLLTFVLCFEGRGWYRRSIFAAPLILSLIAMSWGLNTPPADINVMMAVPAYGIGTFCCCMFFHGELSLRKPAAEYLTRFYLTLSLGGAVGGTLIGVVAPNVLDGMYEFPVVLVITAGLMLVLLRHYLTANKAAYIVLALAIVSTVLTVLMAGASINHDMNGTLMRMRNFYAASQVVERKFNGETMRVLNNGQIMHGLQVRSAEKIAMPTTYYGASSGVAHAMRRFADAPRNVGVIGLGVGTMAAYGKDKDVIRFYEINPQSQLIAQREFSFLKDSAADIQVVLGDARLQMQAELERGEPGQFDVLVVDAFSGDSIPVHLLTKEAMDIYRAHMKPNGIIAFHVSNLFLNLKPVVADLAANAGLQAVYMRNEEKYPETASAWVLVTSDQVFLNDPDVLKQRRPIAPIAGLELWTDSRNNLYQILD